MNYHNQKMNDINKIISELWRNTYRGNGKLLIFYIYIVLRAVLPSLQNFLYLS